MVLTEGANVLFKLGLDRMRFDLRLDNVLSEGVRAVTNPWIAGGLCLYAAGMLGWFTVLAGFRYSSANFFFSLHYLLMLASATVIFREAITPTKLIGAGLIVAGVALIGREKG